MIDRLSGRVALLLVAAALLLIILLSWFVLISPQRSKASTLTGQIDNTNVQLEAVTSLLQGPVGRQTLASLRLFQNAIPNNPKMSQILRQFSTAAALAGVEVDGVTPQPLVPGVGNETLPITLLLKGHYFGLQKFLRTLGHLADLQNEKVHATGRLYSISDISFVGGQSPTIQSSGQTSTSGPSSLIAATLTVNAFAYSPGSTVPTTTPTTTTGGGQSTSAGTP